jgi:hypothetical protein
MEAVLVTAIEYFCLSGMRGRNCMARGAFKGIAPSKCLQTMPEIN